jgi:hypothetical protein
VGTETPGTEATDDALPGQEETGFFVNTRLFLHFIQTRVSLPPDPQEVTVTVLYTVCGCTGVFSCLPGQLDTAKHQRLIPPSFTVRFLSPSGPQLVMVTSTVV